MFWGIVKLDVACMEEQPSIDSCIKYSVSVLDFGAIAAQSQTPSPPPPPPPPPLQQDSEEMEGT